MSVWVSASSTTVIKSPASQYYKDPPEQSTQRKYTHPDARKDSHFPLPSHGKSRDDSRFPSPSHGMHTTPYLSNQPKASQPQRARAPAQPAPTVWPAAVTAPSAPKTVRATPCSIFPPGSSARQSLPLVRLPAPSCRRLRRSTTTLFSTRSFDQA